VVDGIVTCGGRVDGYCGVKGKWALYGKSVLVGHLYLCFCFGTVVDVESMVV
jgi:hypothetical protein